MRNAILPYLTRDTDFTYVISGVKDRTSYFYGGLNGSLGADVTNYGASYSWSPKGVNSAVAPNHETLFHEWLHQLAFVINKIQVPPPPFVSYTGVGDYNGQRLSCQTSFNGPYSYFPPNADFAPYDPDFAACRGGFEGNWEGYCNSLVSRGFDSQECNLQWNTHLLADHIDPGHVVVGNACRNGRRDFNETGVDSGGHCTTYDR